MNHQKVTGLNRNTHHTGTDNRQRLARWLLCIAILLEVNTTFAQENVTENVQPSHASQTLPPEMPKSVDAPATPEHAVSNETNGATPVCPANWIPREFSASAKNALTLGALSLAPAAMLMTTSFVRLSIVLGLLRQALGGANLPSQQVMTALSLCLTFIVMGPTWQEVYREAIVPYTQNPSDATWEQSWRLGVRPVRNFMSRQIQVAGNDEDVIMFLRYSQPDTVPLPKTYEDVPLPVLLSAFLLSELKTAFLLGFQIYLPFLVIDLVVASVTTSVGMMMLPPAMVSLPVKLLLFVLVDGWRLVVGMLLDSFQIIF